METQRRRKLIGIAVAAVAVCGGGAAIAAIAIGSGSPAPVTKVAFSGSAAPGAQGSGGGPGGLSGGGGFGGGFRGGFRGAGGFGQSLGAAASYLGVTTAALQSDLSAGKTLAQVAATQGKSVDGLIAAMVAAQKTQLDALVKSGRMTAAQEQQLASFMKQRITAEVNGTRPSFGGGGRDGFDGGGFGGGGFGGGSGGSGTFGGGSGTQTPPAGSATA